MPSAQKVSWAKLKVGIMAIAAMIILGVLIFYLTGSKKFFANPHIPLSSLGNDTRPGTYTTHFLKRHKENPVFSEADNFRFYKCVLRQVTRLNKADIPDIGPRSEAFDYKSNALVDPTVDLYRVYFFN